MKIEQISPRQEGKEKYHFKEEAKKQITDKLWAAWRAARSVTAKSREGQGEVVNQHMTGEIFHSALFEPKAIEETINKRLEAVGSDVKDLSIPEDDMAILTLPMKDPAFLTEVIDKDEFVSKYWHAMTNEVRFQDAYFDGATDETEKMLEHGPVRIWTTGDVYGIDSFNLPGHKEQIKRLARGGFNELRRRELPQDIFSVEQVCGIAENHNKIVREYKKLGIKGDRYKNEISEEEISNMRELLKPGTYKEILHMMKEVGVSEETRRIILKSLKKRGHFGFVADENKFRDLPEVMKDFKAKRVNRVVVIDDKVGNLLKFKKNLGDIDKDLADSVIMVWDTESQQKSGVNADHIAKLKESERKDWEVEVEKKKGIEVKQIKGLVEVVTNLAGNDPKIKYGYIVDHDDVISEDNKRNALQEDKIIQLLEKILSEEESGEEPEREAA